MVPEVSLNNPAPIIHTSAPSEHAIKEIESDPALLSIFQKCLETLLADGATIYLEGLGFLLPNEKEKIVRRVHRDSFYLIHQTHQRIDFEKCDDTAGMSHEELNHIIDTGGIADFLFKQHTLTISIPKLRVEIRKIIRSIKQELLQQGYSRKLGSIGVLLGIGDFSPHRGGFSQIDLLLIPAAPHTITTSKDGPFIRPLLRDSFELLTAAFGKPLTSTTVFLREFLGTDYEGSFTVGAFHMRGSSPRLFLASEGLRSFGAECVVEIPMKAGEEPKIPGWALQMMALGWYGLQTVKARKLIRGVILDAGAELLPGINHILIHERSGMRDRHLSQQGEFMFLSISGITDEEARFATRTSPDFLIHGLNHRGWKGITKSNRQPLWRGLSESNILKSAH